MFQIKRRKYLSLLLATGVAIAIYRHISGHSSAWLRTIIWQKETPNILPPFKGNNCVIPTMPYILPPFEGNNSVHFLDVICVFPLLETKEMSKARYSHINTTLREKREKEYIYSLKRNLNHPAVATLHLFSHKPNQLFNKLNNQYGVNLTKAIFYTSTENPTYEEIFVYASRFLQSGFVLILNADNYMGDGFTELDLHYMRTYKIMYSLTRRHLAPLPPNCNLGPPSYCEDNSTYVGSHDCFLFHLDFSLPNDFLKKVHIASHSYGSENIVIWSFQNMLNYSVLNPCKVMHIHHVHCSAVRDSKRDYLNITGVFGGASFSSSLTTNAAVKKTKDKI